MKTFRTSMMRTFVEEKNPLSDRGNNKRRHTLDGKELPPPKSETISFANFCRIVPDLTHMVITATRNAENPTPLPSKLQDPLFGKAFYENGRVYVERMERILREFDEEMYPDGKGVIKEDYF